jgi:hypothetical protein
MYCIVRLAQRGKSIWNFYVVFIFILFDLN